MSDRDVRKLAEEIVQNKYPAILEGTRILKGSTERWEARIRAFLAEQETEQAGAMAALRGALEPLKACEFPAEHRHGGGWKDNEGSPEGMLTIGEIRAIQAALATDAGRLEADVLQAAVAEHEAEAGLADESLQASLRHTTRKSVRALRAARGGEG